MKQQRNVRGIASLKTVIVVFVAGLAVTVGAIMFGRMDTGQIDVSATISSANVVRSAGGESQVAQPAPQVFQNMPNGGLVGKGDEGTPPPPPPAPENASTTPEGENASSTEEVPAEAEPEPAE